MYRKTSASLSINIIEQKYDTGDHILKDEVEKASKTKMNIQNEDHFSNECCKSVSPNF